MSNINKMFNGVEQKASTENKGGRVYNPDDVKDIEVPPQGKYNVTITGATDETSQNGNPMIKLKMSINGGDFETYATYTNLVFTPKAQFKIKEFVIASKLGDGTKPVDFNDLDTLLGLTLDVFCEHRIHQERKYLSVSQFLKPEEVLQDVDEEPVQETETPKEKEEEKDRIEEIIDQLNMD